MSKNLVFTCVLISGLLLWGVAIAGPCCQTGTPLTPGSVNSAAEPALLRGLYGCNFLSTFPLDHTGDLADFCGSEIRDSTLYNSVIENAKTGYTNAEVKPQYRYWSCKVGLLPPTLSVVDMMGCVLDFITVHGGTYSGVTASRAPCPVE